MTFRFDPNIIKEWLANWQGKRVIYPDVARSIVDWVKDRRWETPGSRAELVQELWSRTSAPDVPSFSENPCPKLDEAELPETA